MELYDESRVKLDVCVICRVEEDQCLAYLPVVPAVYQILHVVVTPVAVNERLHDFSRFPEHLRRIHTIASDGVFQRESETG